MPQQIAVAPRETAMAPIATVRSTAAYELVVEQLRKAIFLGRFVPGEKLPSERDLASQMLVSRTTVREAIRVLEGEGLVSVKRGATGGLTVLPQDRLSSSEIEAYIRAQLGILDNLFDYRVANECAAASFAAMRRTQAHLDRLRRALDTMNAICATPESRAIATNIARFNSAEFGISSRYRRGLHQSVFSPGGGGVSGCDVPAGGESV